MMKRAGAKSAAVASDPSETILVRQITMRKIGATAASASGAIASAVPKPVAIPRPPLNPTQMERVAPMTAKSAAITVQVLVQISAPCAAAE